MSRAAATLRMLGPRYLLTAAGASVLTALVIGVPTDVLPNPWFTRMTPVRTLDLVLWPITSVLTGALLATYILPAACVRRAPGPAGIASGTLGWLAIGCPICNKLVVGAIGITGALNVFAPLQPLLGLLGVSIAAIGLALRMRLVRPPIPSRASH